MRAWEVRQTTLFMRARASYALRTLQPHTVGQVQKSHPLLGIWTLDLYLYFCDKLWLYHSLYLKVRTMAEP